MSGLRLAMGPAENRDRLDGGWWPRSRVLATELAGLVDDFPTDLGRVVSVLYSPGDWDDAPLQGAGPAASVEVGELSGDDSHVVRVTTSDGGDYCLLVVPPAFDDAQGAEALLASATAGNRHSAAELLDVVTNELPVDPAGQWPATGAP